MDSLLNTMKQHIDAKGDMSFAELMRQPKFSKFDIEGDLALCSPKDPNLIYWAGLSRSAYNTINNLLADGYTLFPTLKLIYYTDGMTLKFPIATNIPENGFNDFHWLPVIIIKTADIEKYSKDHKELEKCTT
jgi:hypothetical protein